MRNRLRGWWWQQRRWLRPPRKSAAPPSWPPVVIIGPGGERLENPAGYPPGTRRPGDDQAHRDWYHRTMTHPPRPRPAAQLTVTARCETIIGAVLRFYDLAEAKAAAAIPGYSWDSTERITA